MSSKDSAAHTAPREPLGPHLFPGMGKYADKGECPDKHLHAGDEPSSYLGWHEWAREKRKTHTQSQCPTCGYWTIWTPIKGASRV